MKKHIVSSILLASLASLSMACVDAASELEPTSRDDSYALNDLSHGASSSDLAMSTSALAAIPNGTAVFDGSYVDITGETKAYSVNAQSDGTVKDSEGRTGTYSLMANATGGGRVLTLNFGRLGIHDFYEGPANCWAEAQPPINPGLSQLAICLSPSMQEIAHFDTQGCADLSTAPIYLTAALPQENGQWMGGRLTPATLNGFWVHKVTYVLNTMYNDNNGFHCTAADHRVQVFLGDAGSPPPANPVVLHEAMISGASLVNEYHEVGVTLPAPILIPPGKSLFVSIEMIREDIDEVCMGMCGSMPAQPDLTFWSDAVVAPYGWYDLQPYNGFYDIMVRALGIKA